MVTFVLEYWLEVVFAAALSVLAGAYRRIRIKVREQDSIRLGVQALLRDRIIQGYYHCVKEGECDIHTRENINALYEQYRALGGNGTIEHLMHVLDTLPTPGEGGRR